jgi:hypothetical protein
LEVQRRGVARLKDTLDGAGLLSRTNQRLVGALSDQELEGTDDNGLARTGLTRDGSEATARSPGEFLNQSEIADAQGGELYGSHGGRIHEKKHAVTTD